VTCAAVRRILQPEAANGIVTLPIGILLGELKVHPLT
jgi:hypothetical protein